MDPSMYLPYSAPAGLPQESKLASYLQNRTVTAPTRPVTQAMGKMSLDSSPQSIKKVLITGEFIPMNYYGQPSMMPEAPEPAHQAPQAALAAHMATTSQVHQENVGGTTYFYATNAETMNASALNTSGSMAGASEPHLSGAMGPGASPYATQMYAGNPPHMPPNMSIKPVGTWQAVPMPNMLCPVQLHYQPYPYNEAHWAGAGYSPRYSPRYSPIYSPRFSPRSDMENDNLPAPDFTESLAASFYQPETIRQEIYQRNEEMLMQADIRQFPDLPETVEMYAELIPLESAAPHSLATSFRATHRQSGEPFAIRRLHSYSSIPTKRLEMWKGVDHPNVVKLQDYFTTQSFGDHSMVLVYSYHPSCETLMNKYLAGGANNSSVEGNQQLFDPFSSDPDAPRPYTHQKNTMLRAVACGALLPEAVLWSLLVQLTAALRAIHAAGLACRSLDPTKVVMNGCRVRVAWVGAADATLANPNDVPQAQQDDLTALGRLALALACRTIHCDNLAASMDLVSRTYSADLKNVILYLLSATNRRSVTDLMPMIGARFYTQVEALQRRADVFEEQLAREIDNSRLLRILIKLGVVNERPELNLDASWSETGNRYMLKLFRDYLFHAVTADGSPWIDQAHLTYSLNQLDAGTLDRVELMSRDEQSVLVVSYAELKHCLEAAFDEVMTVSARP